MIGKARIGRTTPLLLAALAVALLCGPAGLARGETFLVSNLDDAGPGSLREAIEIANMTEGPDVITFAPELLGGTIGLTSGQLEITDDLTIEGPGANRLVVSRTAGPFRVFLVQSGATVEISGLSITGGFSLDYGGGIYNAGTLTVTGCTISQNCAIGRPGTFDWVIHLPYGGGGGLYNCGVLVLEHSTLSDNCGAYEGGGGLLNRGSSIVVNSTFSGNVAFGDYQPAGGAILDVGIGVVLNCTVTNNWYTNPAGFFGDGVCTHLLLDWPYDDLAEFGHLEMRNTILAGNGSCDLSGSLAASGYNLIGDGTNGTGYVETDLVGPITLEPKKNPKFAVTQPIDPKLAPLADNGGPTWTHALYTGSPAIEAGDPEFLPPPDTDQRGEGFPRVINGRIDIGAFEGAIEPPRKKK